MPEIHKANALGFIFYELSKEEEVIIEKRDHRYATFNFQILEIVKKILNDEFKSEFYIYPTSSRFLIGIFSTIHTELKNILKYHKVGRPDLIAFNREKYLFVELKIGTDRLRTEQLKWAIFNQDIPIVVCFLQRKKNKGRWGRAK